MEGVGLVVARTGNVGWPRCADKGRRRSFDVVREEKIAVRPAMDWVTRWWWCWVN